MHDRIILEEKYLADLVQLTNDAQAIPNKDNAIGIQKCFLSYVDLTDEYKPFREQYLQRLKKQLEELKEFRASCVLCLQSILYIYFITE